LAFEMTVPEQYDAPLQLIFSIPLLVHRLKNFAPDEVHHVAPGTCPLHLFEGGGGGGGGGGAGF